MMTIESMTLAAGTAATPDAAGADAGSGDAFATVVDRVAAGSPADVRPENDRDVDGVAPTVVAQESDHEDDGDELTRDAADRDADGSNPGDHLAAAAVIAALVESTSITATATATPVTPPVEPTGTALGPVSPPVGSAPGAAGPIDLDAAGPPAGAPVDGADLTTPVAAPVVDAMPAATTNPGDPSAIGVTVPVQTAIATDASAPAVASAAGNAPAGATVDQVAPAATDAAPAPVTPEPATAPVAAPDAAAPRAAAGAHRGDDVPDAGEPVGPPAVTSDEQSDPAATPAPDAAIPTGPAQPSGTTEVTGPASALARPVQVASVDSAPATTAVTATSSPEVVDAPDPNVARIGGAVRSLRNGMGHSLTLALTPDHLGRVTVDVATDAHGGVHLHLRADLAEGAAALGAATHGLRNELESQGLRLDRLSVSVGSDGDGGPTGQRGEADVDRSTPRPDTRPRAASTAELPRPILRPARLAASSDRLDLDL